MSYDFGGAIEHYSFEEYVDWLEHTAKAKPSALKLARQIKPSAAARARPRPSGTPRRAGSVRSGGIGRSCTPSCPRTPWSGQARCWPNSASTRPPSRWARSRRRWASSSRPRPSPPWSSTPPGSGTFRLTTWRMRQAC